MTSSSLLLIRPSSSSSFYHTHQPHSFGGSSKGMGWAIALHGGAGDIPPSLPPERRLPREAALRRCLEMGVHALQSNTPPLRVVELVVLYNTPFLLFLYHILHLLYFPIPIPIPTSFHTYLSLSYSLFLYSGFTHTLPLFYHYINSKLYMHVLFIFSLSRSP